MEHRPLAAPHLPPVHRELETVTELLLQSGGEIGSQLLRNRQQDLTSGRNEPGPGRCVCVRVRDCMLHNNACVKPHFNCNITGATAAHTTQHKSMKTNVQSDVINMKKKITLRQF